MFDNFLRVQFQILSRKAFQITDTELNVKARSSYNAGHAAFKISNRQAKAVKGLI